MVKRGRGETLRCPAPGGCDSVRLQGRRQVRPALLLRAVAIAWGSLRIGVVALGPRTIAIAWGPLRLEAFAFRLRTIAISGRTLPFGAFAFRFRTIVAVEGRGRAVVQRMRQ